MFIANFDFMQMDKSHLAIEDAEKIADEAHLLYVRDNGPGITRKRKGKGWIYLMPDGSICKDEHTLLRIKKLVLPPAWKNVWICPKANGHLQATGIDAKNRKQYKYHPDWEGARTITKFNRMILFGQALPILRQQVEKDLRQKNLNEKKVIALVIYLLDKTAIRIGNSAYEKMYGSYGITTLKDKHVKIKGSKLKIRFNGKKGVLQDLEVTNARLARLVKKCRDIPGQELFQYYNSEGETKSIESGMINQYIQEVTGMNFTAKDFRTWKASVYAVRTLMNLCEDKNTSTQKHLISCFDFVARKLGNSKAICRKYYVHPKIIDLFEKGEFQKKSAVKLNASPSSDYYKTGEANLLRLLGSAADKPRQQRASRRNIAAA